MDKLQSIRFFIRVAQAGSFTAVANQMQVTKSGLSRSIDSLEKQLGARLLQRTTRQVRLTDVGRRYVERLTGIIAELDQADAEAAGSLMEPAGLLRVHCVPGLALSHLTAAIVQYQALYPLVTVQLSLTEGMPNLIGEGFDVSLVAAAQLPDSAFVSSRLGSTYGIIAASPEYVRTHPPVTSVGDLALHPFLRLNVAPNETTQTTFVSENGQSEEMVPPAARLIVNSDEAMKIALRAGAGIGTLGIHAATEGLKAGQLVRLLPNVRVDPQDVYVVYASRRYLDAKIRTFKAFVKEIFEHESLSQSGLTPCVPARRLYPDNRHVATSHIDKAFDAVS